MERLPGRTFVSAFGNPVSPSGDDLSVRGAGFYVFFQRWAETHGPVVGWTASGDVRDAILKYDISLGGFVAFRKRGGLED